MVLIDFDICSLKNSSIQTIKGTQGFIAPEVWKGLDYDYRCDTYSFGKTIGEWMKKYNIADTELMAVVSRMCSENPDERSKLASVIAFADGDIGIEGLEIDQGK